LERPGKNNLSFFSVCRRKGFFGCGETTCWTFLNLLYILEGLSNFAFAISLCFYLALPSFFSYYHVGISIGSSVKLNTSGCSIPIVIIVITHSCRERHVSNILEGNEVEIDDENLKDFEVEEKDEVEMETIPITTQDHQSMKNLPTYEENTQIIEQDNTVIVTSTTTSTSTTSTTTENTLVNRRKYTDEVKDEVKDDIKQVDTKKKEKKIHKLNGCCGIGRNMTCFIFEKTIGDYLESLWNGLKKKILLYCIALIFGISLM
jgi:hypothetical protein